MGKRGMSQVLWIVVASALLLIAMVVIGFIFGWSMGDVSDTLKNCEVKGGECIGNCQAGKQILIADCPDEGDVCCLIG